ncbi:hypothetical protein N9N02_03430 [Candidatus Poseidoniales archaeon]|nr:hypothetical protein [Candidatus Poseidoniales archaeon]
MQPPIPSAANATTLLQLSKLIPTYMGYSEKPSNDDDKELREYIRLEWTNCRKTIESLRVTSNDKKMKTDFDTLLTEIDVIESELRTSPTGAMAKKIDKLSSIDKKTIENLVQIDLDIIEIIKKIQASITETSHSSDEESYSGIEAIISQITQFRSKYNARRAIINGVPLDVVQGQKTKSSIKWVQIASLSISLLAIGVTIYFNLR